MAKAKPISLLKELGGGYEASVVTTYAAHLPFYEHVVLGGLTAAGCRQNMLVVDSGECVKALSDISTRPEDAGTRYVLAPVTAPGAFHPKIILLVGRSHGALYVGSHNATVSGFTFNREVTTRVLYKGRGDDHARATIREAWQYVRDWLDGAADPVLRMTERIAAAAPWLADDGEQGEQILFLGSRRSGPSLWQQLKPLLPSRVKRCTIVAPFFDRTLDFVSRLLGDCSPQQTIIAVDPNSVEVSQRRKRLQRVKFVNSSGLDETRRGPLHAKAFLFEGARGEWLLATGSANASAPAWTAGPGRRNAEAIVVHRGRIAERIATEIGLAGLKTLAPLSDDDWDAIDSRQDEKEPVGRHLQTLVADVFNDGFEISELSAGDPRVEEVRLLTRDGGRIGMAIQEPGEGSLYCRVSPPEQLESTSLIEIADADGVWAYAIPHRARELERLTRTPAQDKLARALEALAAGTGDAAAIVEIASKLILAPGSWVPPAHDRKPRAAGQRRTHRARSLRHVTSSGDLAFLIDLISSRVGAGLASAAAERSASELREEEQLAETAEVAAAQVRSRLVLDQVADCSRRVARLVKKIGAKLELAPGEFDAAEVVSQLAAVLIVVKALRELDLDSRVSSTGATYVSIRARRDLAWHSVRTLYGDPKPLVELALEEARLPASEEVSLVRALSAWIAFDAQAPDDALEEEEDEWQIVEARGLARAALRRLIGDPKARAALEEAFSLIQSTPDPAQLLGFESVLAERLLLLEGTDVKRVKASRAPLLGDCVVYRRNGIQRVSTVLEISGGKVTLLDLDTPNGEVQYASAFVTPIDGLPGERSKR